jgi:oligopeptide transport system permease protein
MAEQLKITPEMWELVPREEVIKDKIVRKSLTYWEDVWRRLKHNTLSIIGLIIIVFMIVLAVGGPFIAKFAYSDQDLKMANIPPTVEIFEYDGKYYNIHKEYKIIEFTKNGETISGFTAKEDNKILKFRTYEINGHTFKVDYSLAAKAKKDPSLAKYELSIDNAPYKVENSKKVWNKTYWFGTDTLGRDIFVRNIYGARISLTIALMATLVQFFIGVVYGGISGYVGGSLDNLMMRIVDLINSIPLLLYVILLMVVMGAGLVTIMVALGSVYWVLMARLVRGQVLSIKENEFVLAARTLGASSWRIMVKHLIPNAMGPIIVSLAMMVPSAIFSEAFLSFVGLGVSAPQASWGTLANDAMAGLRTYPYQLFIPSFFISMTVLSFNFLGDGLRDALDPRLRK